MDTDDCHHNIASDRRDELELSDEARELLERGTEKDPAASSMRVESDSERPVEPDEAGPKDVDVVQHTDILA